MRQTAAQAAEPITIMFAPNGFVVRLTGDIGPAVARQLRQQLTWVAALSPRRLVLDLSEAKVVDRTALDVLAELRGSLAKQGGEVRLAGLTARVRTDLKASKLQRLFRIYRDLQTAVSW
ncbi:MAG: STAS domain-containing protein [Planctomycetia bacterium]|nr:STAS domain-containing protein [Planctomycetia bacterium]